MLWWYQYFALLALLGCRIVGLDDEDLAEVEAWPERIGAVTTDQILAAARETFDLRRSVTSELLSEPRS